MVTTFATMQVMIGRDNPSLPTNSINEIALRIYSRKAIPNCCIHQMPEGLSAFDNGICIRCGQEI